jgi:hypothetical protein
VAAIDTCGGCWPAAAATVLTILALATARAGVQADRAHQAGGEPHHRRAEEGEPLARLLTAVHNVRHIEDGRDHQRVVQLEIPTLMKSSWRASDLDYVIGVKWRR